MGPWAHPRSRGENCTYAINASTDAGSSPLTRGKHRQRGRLLDRNRLIPAHAGKTSKLEGTDVNFEAHPRSRGENMRFRRRLRRPCGSSPLTRGKQLSDGRDVAVFGLIPAHAGKTRSPRRPRVHAGAHPRSRGENTARSRPAKRYSGSSPLTRGKPSSTACLRRRWRLIPAHAGKTGEWSHLPRGCGAHPRSRGENARRTRDLLGCGGSSPLTRGKHHWYREGFFVGRLIPAHAGKTRPCRPPSTTEKAHPRSRGENPVGAVAGILSGGSSPLTRGKPLELGAQHPVARLIPAHAGKTPSTRS